MRLRREAQGTGGKGRSAVREDKRTEKHANKSEQKPTAEASQEARARKKVIARLRRLHPMD